MSAEAEFLTTYESIKGAYKDAMKNVDEAVDYEEKERPGEAIAAYESCLKVIDDAFAKPVGLPENIDAVEPEWNDACTIIQKLKSAKIEISYRLKILRAQNGLEDGAAVDAYQGDEIDSDNSEPVRKKKSVQLENPQTYFDIRNSSGKSKTYRQIIAGLREAIAIKDSGIQLDRVFEFQGKMYHIQPSGDVSTIMVFGLKNQVISAEKLNNKFGLQGEVTISLAMCTCIAGDKYDYLNGIYCIQCAIPPEMLPPRDDNEQGSMVWIYPLIPTITNCYRTDYGAFILPDMESDVPGTAFGIIIVDPSNDTGSNNDMEQIFLDLLEAVLDGTVDKFETQGPRDASQQVSTHIVTAADFVARNLVRGAEKTAELMIKSTPYIMSKMEPAPADAPPVSTKLQTSVEVAKNVTSVAAGVTGWVSGRVGTASMALGRYLAPHIHTQGATLLQKGFGYDSMEANSKMEGAMAIVADAVEGFSTIYNGLETSAKILGKNLSDNSVKIIEHKYGPSAGNVASGTFDTIGNAFNVSQNVNYMTPKGIVKKIAKNTGKAVVEDYKQNPSPELSHYVPAGTLYPNLRSLKNN